jgi:hypothetical protein
MNSRDDLRSMAKPLDDLSRVMPRKEWRKLAKFHREFEVDRAAGKVPLVIPGAGQHWGAICAVSIPQFYWNDICGILNPMCPAEMAQTQATAKHNLGIYLESYPSWAAVPDDVKPAFVKELTIWHACAARSRFEAEQKREHQH